MITLSQNLINTGHNSTIYFVTSISSYVIGFKKPETFK